MQSTESPICQHIKTNGARCGSPALKDKLFCFYHERCRTLKFEYGRPNLEYSRFRELILPVFEDSHSIQFSLHQITERILRRQIDPREAGLVLYALQIASCNLKHLDAEIPEPSEMVTVEPPDETPRDTPEEIEARRQAAHARFEAMFPLDPKPATTTKPNLLADNG